MITINYQYWSIRFLTEDENYEEKTATILTDADYETCFKTLVEGEQNVLVKCRKGYLRSLHEYLKLRYIFVKAAGGVVENDNGELLLMTRNGRADLPKGKVEAGETLAEAALRETGEETGLSNVTLGPMLLKSYHIYDLYGGWHFKQTTWYRMLLSGNQKLVPQTEEQITDVGWYAPDRWRRELNDSYATMRLVVGKVFDND